MKIAVAMSGGVDSSVTAALLQQQGHQVIGISMRLFEPCSSGAGSAAYDASVVALHLGIEHHVVDFEPQFKEMIIDDFISEYRCGHTPNPCVRCNRFVKFGLLLDAAHRFGAEFLATGHYVRKTVDPDGTCHLRTACNIRKDQSYFLYSLTQEKLKQLLFPLGEVESKDAVRLMAKEFGLPVADKGDSQEICFIPNDDYMAFLEKAGSVCTVRGDIIHVTGKKVGEHGGTHRYTIGQRKGLGIAWSEPLYVVGLDTELNRVIVGEEGFVFAEGLRADQVSWIQKPAAGEYELFCKIRYRHQPVPCNVTILDETHCEILFNQPQKSVTPGQSVVFYLNDEVLGGGIILTSLQRQNNNAVNGRVSC